MIAVGRRLIAIASPPSRHFSSLFRWPSFDGPGTPTPGVGAASDINQVLAAKGLLWMFAVRVRREPRWHGVLEWCIVGAAGTGLE